MARETVTKTVICNGSPTEITMRQMLNPATQEQLDAMTPEQREDYKFQSPLNTSTYECAPGIICMQDQPVKMRDGVTIYVDIYRPNDGSVVPLIVSWSFYGKRPFDGQSEWQIMGVPPQTVSNMSKFESPDPGYWCRHGYAVANVDPRGVGHSGGDFVQFGTQEGRDGYDFIEWAAAQSWCNGHVGLAGNSCVAMTQWRIASQQPPHLSCIAPWEGTSDMYRESLYEGGIPAHTFVGMVVREAVGPNYIDDTAANSERYPFIDCDYWKDKDPIWKNITIPVYATACWNHFHCRGSIQAFRKIKSRKKWLRCHRDFEWPDAYNNKNLQELERFFDRYLKEENNGWELTPTVRIEVQDTGEFNYQETRPETSFPLKRTKYEKLYLDASDMSMKAEPVAEKACVGYDSETEEVTFDYRRGLQRRRPVRERPEALDHRRVAPRHPLWRAAPRRLGQDARLTPQARREALDRLPAYPGPHLRREGRARPDRPRRHRDLAHLPLLAQGSADSRAGGRPLHSRGLVRAADVGHRQSRPHADLHRRRARLVPADPGDPAALPGRRHHHPLARFSLGAGPRPRLGPAPLLSPPPRGGLTERNNHEPGRL